MKRRLSSTLSLVVSSLGSFTRRKTWLISFGKRNQLTPTGKFISKVLNLLVCSAFTFFPPFISQLMDLGTRTAGHNLRKLRKWIQQQPLSSLSYLKETTPSCQQVATLVTSLTCIGTILLNISLFFFKSKYPDSIHFEPSRIGHSLQSTLSCVPFCWPRKRYPLC